MNDSKRLWPVASLLVLTGFNLFDYLDRYLLASTLPVLQADLKISDEQAGTLWSAFMLGYFLTSPIFGYLGDRLPRRWLIAAGVFVWSFGTLMSGHVSTFVALLWFRVLVGFGEASFGTISPSWIADLFPKARRNNAITIFYFAIPVGSALGYLLGSYMAVHHGWRSAFIWAGCPGLALAFVLLLLREPARGATATVEELESEKVATAGGWRRYLQLLKFPRYNLVIVGYIAQAFAMGGFSLWAPTFLFRVHHMNLEAAGRFFSEALAATGLVATLAGGFLATQWEKRTRTGYAWVLALSSLAAAPVAFAAFTLPDLDLAKAALVLAMFLLFLPTGPLNTLILETVPVTMRASAVAASIFSIHLFGDMWSPKLVGYLSDRWGDLQRAVLWVLPVTLIISAFFWCWLVVRTKRDLALLPRESVPASA